jgi:hypothetical protein
MSIGTLETRTPTVRHLCLALALAGLVGACSSAPTEPTAGGSQVPSTPTAAAGSPAFCAQLADSPQLNALVSSLPRILSDSPSKSDTETVMGAADVLMTISKEASTTDSTRLALRDSASALTSWAQEGLGPSGYSQIAAAFEKLNSATQTACHFSLN